MADLPPLTDEQLADIRNYLEGCKGADLADVPADLRRYEKWLMEADGRALLLLMEVDRLRAALAEREALAAEYGARIAIATLAAAPRTPGVGR